MEFKALFHRDTRQSISKVVFFSLSITLFLTGTLLAQGQQVAHLNAPNWGLGDHFGHSVSIDGPWAVIGAPEDDDNGTDSGSVYVYKLEPQTQRWSYYTQLFGKDRMPGDRFGVSVSISDDLIAVGAREDDERGTDSGSVDLFRYTTAKGWTYERTLTASNGNAGDQFGGSVSVSGGIVAVGARFRNHSSAIQKSGSAYIYRDLGGGVWFEEAFLTDPNPGHGERYGFRVSADGDVVAVSVWGGNQPFTNAGSAWVYRFSNASGTWIQDGAELFAPDASNNDRFGADISVSGDTIIVGADEHDHQGPPHNGLQAGAAYLYSYNSSSRQWIFEKEIFDPNPASNDCFGTNVDIAGNLVLVGARNDVHFGIDSGSAFLFRYDSASNDWLLANKLFAIGRASGDRFGQFVSLSSLGHALIGAPNSDTKGSDAGSTYVFDLLTLSINPAPLKAGYNATFTVDFGLPNAATQLFYGVQGPGTTFDPFFNVTLDIRNAKTKGISLKTSDSSGRTVWNLNMPPAFLGRNVWVQAAQQHARKSKLVATWVQ